MDAMLSLDGFSVGIGARTIVDGVSLEVGRGEIVALTGESGAGKSLTGYGILGLLPQGGWVSGACRINGAPVNPMDERAIRPLRGRTLGMVFQDPVAALDPAMTIGAQLVETIRQHQKLDHTAARRMAENLLTTVEIDDAADRLGRYPAELSGGQCQRVMIALALAGNPALLIADEPTTALDSATEAGILALIRRLARARGIASLLITHDLDTVAGYADHVAILYAGRVVETGPALRMITAPRHPYTSALVRTRLTGAVVPKTDLPVVDGPSPQPGACPGGCRFHPRCPVRQERCGHESPHWSGMRMDGFACWAGPAQ